MLRGPSAKAAAFGNAIVGSGLLLLLSFVHRFSAWHLHVEFTFPSLVAVVLVSSVRFLIDTLTGIPSIVTGVFVYASDRSAHESFFGVRRRIALALIMIPIVARTTEEMIKLVPHSLREGALALGAPQWRVTLGRGPAGRCFRNCNRRNAGYRARSRRNSAAVFTAFGSRFFR